MAVTLSGSAGVSVSVQDSRTGVTGALNETGSRNFAVSMAWSLATGTGTGLADKCWSNTDTVLTSATNTIDLSAVQINVFGAIETFVKVKCLVVVSAQSNATNLSVTRPAGGLPFITVVGAVAVIGAGGFYAWADPTAGITAGADPAASFTIVNSAGPTATYTVAVIGTTA
jgi:hypothetical protein